MTLVFTMLLMMLIVVAMAVGLFFGRRPLQGSCGGLAQLGLGDCEFCGGDPQVCETRAGSVEPIDPARAHLPYDATRRDF